MYCANCGHKNTDESLFCAGCGLSLLSDGTMGSINSQDTDSKTEKKQEVKPKMKKWPLLAAAVLVIVAAVLLLLFFVLKSDQSDDWVMPIFYQKDDSVYMAVGKDSIALPDIQLTEKKSMNAMIDIDRQYLYYLSGSNEEHNLLRIKLNDPKAEPKQCSEDVDYAIVSPDGNRVLLIKNTDNNAGILYEWKDGKETKIAESVATNGLGFSPNGKIICYLAIEDVETGGKTLYLKNGKSDPLQVVTDLEKNILFSALVFDDGSVLYTVHEEKKEALTLYKYSKGNVNKVGDGSLAVAFSSSELLIQDGKSLYYFNSGDMERISKDISHLYFPLPWQYLLDVRKFPDKHFAFSERQDSSEYVLYEYESGKQQMEIVQTDNDRFSIDQSFKWVEYSNQDDTLYLIHKTGGEWGDRLKLESDVYASVFDDEGYLYYITEDGDFYRYHLKSAKTEDLFQDVDFFRVIDTRIFAITLDQELFLVFPDRNLMIAEDSVKLYETFDGGVFIVMEADNYDIAYLSSNSTSYEVVSSDVDDLIRPQGFIDYSGSRSDSSWPEENEEQPEEAATEMPEETVPEITQESTTETIPSVISDNELNNGIILTLGNEGISASDSLTASDLQQLTYLYLPHASMTDLYHPDKAILLAEAIRDLSGIEFAANLTELYIPGHQIKEIDNLVELTGLELLNISYSDVDDVQIVSQLTNLKALAIGPAVSDISPIFGLVELESLELHGKMIEDIEGLSSLNNIKYLVLSDTMVTDISVAANFPNLEILVFRESNTIDISILQELENLTFVLLDQGTYDANPDTVSYLEEMGCSVTY